MAIVGLVGDSRQETMIPESLPNYSGFRSGAAGQAYNQTAFRHFLAIERRRAERSGRPLFLVLVALSGSNVANQMNGATAGAIFHALGETVREVDFVGVDGEVDDGALGEDAVVRVAVRDDALGLQKAMIDYYGSSVYKLKKDQPN